MAGCFGPKCLQGLFLFFNLIFWLSGCAAITLGVLLIIYNYDYKAYLIILTGATSSPEIVTKFAVGCIAFGGFICFVGIYFNCCRARHDTKFMFGTYVFCLLVIFMVESAGAVLCLYFRFSFPSDHIRSKAMEKFINDYGTTEVHRDFTESLDFVQYKLECCGIEDHKDYMNSKWLNKTTSVAYFQTVPLTCCVQDECHKILQKYPWKEPKPKDHLKCMSGDPVEFNEALNSQGCWNKLRDWYRAYNFVMIVASCGLAIVQIMGMAVIIWLFRNIKN